MVHLYKVIPYVKELVDVQLCLNPQTLRNSNSSKLKFDFKFKHFEQFKHKI